VRAFYPREDAAALIEKLKKTDDNVHNNKNRRMIWQKTARFMTGSLTI
jgi:hypothetical protein